MQLDFRKEGHEENESQISIEEFQFLKGVDALFIRQRLKLKRWLASSFVEAVEALTEL